MARSTFALSSLALLGLGACVDNIDSAVQIIQNNVPEAGCSVPGTVTTGYVGTGLIEAGSAQGYVFTPVLKNYSTLNETGTDEQQKIAFVRGATVDLQFLDPALFDDATEARFRTDGLMHFRVPYSGMITPGGTLSMIFEIVPAELLAAIGEELSDPSDRTLILANISVDGALGAGDFETAAFSFPVEVCNNCLANVLGACSSIPDTFTSPNDGGECNPAQDEVADCCTDGSTLVCPAVGTMPPAVQ